MQTVILVSVSTATAHHLGGVPVSAQKTLDAAVV